MKPLRRAAIVLSKVQDCKAKSRAFDDGSLIPKATFGIANWGGGAMMPAPPED